MNVTFQDRAALLAVVALACGPATAAEDARFSLSTGVDFTTGDYGAEEDIEDFYIPVTGTLDYGRYAFRLTVPYLSVRGPEGTIVDPDGQPLPGSGAITTESGLGDIIASATVLDVITSRDGFAMDLTGKVKFGTADDGKGLGTGENDYSLQAEFYKFGDRFTLLGMVGYKFRGDPVDYDLRDVWMTSVGGSYRTTGNSRIGLTLDYRESSIAGDDAIQELTGFYSRNVGDSWRFQVYAFTGFSDSSPDLGGGILIRKRVDP